MPHTPDHIPINIRMERLDPENDDSPAPAVSTRTARQEPVGPLENETSFAERAVRSRRRPRRFPAEFDSPPELTEEEASLVGDLSGRFNITPRIFERSSEVNTYGLSSGGVETEDVTSPDPTEPSGLSNEPTPTTEIILNEGRNPESETLEEELIHAAQNKLGGDRVEAIVDSVSNEVGVPEETQEEMRNEASISTSEGYSDQPQERFAERLIDEIPTVREGDVSKDNVEALILESLFKQAGKGNSRLEALTFQDL